jgi:hypothetical protein
MHTQINPEYIVAYFEKPIELSRLIRVFQYEISKRRIFKSISSAFGIS